MQDADGGKGVGEVAFVGYCGGLVVSHEEGFQIRGTGLYKRRYIE